MSRISRRQFLGYGAGVGATLTVPTLAWQEAAAAAMAPRLTKYVQPLPVPGAGIVVATPSGPGTYFFTQRKIVRQLHPHLPPTPLWAYDDGSGLAGQAGSFGMAVVARAEHQSKPRSLTHFRRSTRRGFPWTPALLHLGIRSGP